MRGSKDLRMVGLWMLLDALAATGLLDGRQATTQWKDADKLARRYPAVQVERDHIFVRDGSIYTSAGATAGLNLAMAWVEEGFGQDVALAIARRPVMFSKRSGAQRQISALLMAQVPANTTAQQAIELVLEDPAGNPFFIELANWAAMSERTFFTRVSAPN